MPSFLYITGCDGTGKTTLANSLVKQYRLENRPVLHLWLRFPFLFSIPFLVYARMRRFSWYEQVEGKRYGYWDFHLSWILKYILPWSILIDSFLAGCWFIYFPLALGKRIICERYTVDILVDFVTAFRDPSIIDQLPWTWFPRLLPSGARTILLDLDEETIIKRRPALAFDRNLSFRIGLYRRIAERLEIPVLQTLEDVVSVHKRVTDLVSEEIPSVHAYAQVRHPWLRTLLAFPVIAIISHWIFQSIFYMDWTERIFKVLLEIVFTLFFRLLLFPFPVSGFTWIASLLLGHTANFLLNGHLWGLLKFYGPIHYSNPSFLRYTEELKERVQQEPSIITSKIIGGISGGRWSRNSDLDIRLLRNPGFYNAIRSCAFVCWERTRSLIYCFPLDIYVADSVKAFHQMSHSGVTMVPTRVEKP